jgi:hypothetical protein
LLGLAKLSLGSVSCPCALPGHCFSTKYIKANYIWAIDACFSLLYNTFSTHSHRYPCCYLLSETQRKFGELVRGIQVEKLIPLTSQPSAFISSFSCFSENSLNARFPTYKDLLFTFIIKNNMYDM